MTVHHFKVCAATYAALATGRYHDCGWSRQAVPARGDGLAFYSEESPEGPALECQVTDVRSTRGESEDLWVLHFTTPTRRLRPIAPIAVVA